MLSIHNVQTVEGVTVYGDNERPQKFYLVPDLPRFRLDDNGAPVFRFLKYRMPVDREDGKKGGGFCFFDVEFVVPEDKLDPIKEKLQEQVNREFARRNRPAPPVEIGTITYSKGEAHLLLQADDGVLIERVTNPGKPSLYGRNITPFAIEFSPEGATLFWEAMQGRGGVVQVAYDLHFHAALPPVKVRGRFFASKFYSFVQEIDTENRFWSEDDYTETVREVFRDSESMSLDFDWGGLTDEKVRQPIRDWAQSTLESAAERKMLEAIAPVSEEGRQIPDGIEDVKREMSVHKISSFTLRYKESQPVEWFIGPRGTLPNITNLTDAEGNPVRWEDHAKEIDLADPFFKRLDVSVHANADFERLPIASVEVELEYPGTNTVEEYLFKSPDDVGKFATFIENDVLEYQYRYQVNYVGESQTFQAGTETTKGTVLTINVGDLGILDVQVRVGDINFTQVQQAQVTMRYEPSGGPAHEEQFVLDANNREASFQKVIFSQVDRPYRYKVKYFMADGKEYEVDWTEAESPVLFVNDPFSATRTIGVRALGDLQNKIANIFLDLEYVDEDNDYRQRQSVALNQGNPFFDWSIPVIDESKGEVTYEGNIVYRDGTNEAIEETTANADTIFVGDAVADFLTVQVLPNLLDFSQVALVQVSLTYEDPANGISETDDLIFDPQNKAPKSWKLEIEDKAKKDYAWKATFFMADGSQHVTDPETTSAETIVLRPPVPA